MTTTIICFKKPTALFEQLKNDLNYKISQKCNGIYYISLEGSVESKSLLIQFIVSSELEDGVVVLKALSNKIDSETAKKVLELPIDDDEYDVSLLSWWKVMILKNEKLLSEGENMGTWEDVVKKLEKKGILDNRKQLWQERGMQTAAQKIFAFLSSGHSLEEAKKKFAFA